ncbi:hypothetical protein SEA_FLATWOODS_10 [Gordonia phage Flatwoods]|nr:hypothetical protein SEA_FLATWOODS_10 [Gordonia phage Flatwoods]
MSYTDSDLDPTLDAAYAELAAEHLVDAHYTRIMHSIEYTGPGRWLRAGMLDTARNNDVDPAALVTVIRAYAERGVRQGRTDHDYALILDRLRLTDFAVDPAEVAFDDGTRAVWDDTVSGWQFVGEPIAIAR